MAERSTPPVRVFVSGCYDILHAGHVQFFREARALGDHLTVCFASADALWRHKQRRASLPDDHKRALLEALEMVDDVVVGCDQTLGLDFESEFRRLHPDILAVTEDDRFGDAKRRLCEDVGARYVVLGKTPPRFAPLSTTAIVKYIRAPAYAPLRVDFAGGWLDVPRHAREGAYVVNCAISPLVSLRNWPYEKRAGLGGSGAWAVLNGDDGVIEELKLGVGWQDPAVIRETGLCVWRSGPRPVLDFKQDPGWIEGRMALHWTGTSHDTPGVAEAGRDYELIVRASLIARDGVLRRDLGALAQAIDISYQMQMGEGMNPLSEFRALARKYCGGGWGGYALYLFEGQDERDAFVAGDERARPIEPYARF